MRIIGGEWRRRLLSFPDLPGLRPTRQRARNRVQLAGPDAGWSGRAGRLCRQRRHEPGGRFARRPANWCWWKNRSSRPIARRVSWACRAGGSHLRDALAWLMHCRDSFDVIFWIRRFASELLARICRWRPSGARRWLHLYRVRSGGRPSRMAGSWCAADRPGRCIYGLLRRVTDEPEPFLCECEEGSATIQTVNNFEANTMF